MKLFLSISKFCFAALLLFSESGIGQEIEYFQTDGVIKVQNKYSIIVQTRDGDLPVKLTNNTQVALRLLRPEIDFEKRKLTMQLLNSAPDGIYENNDVVEFDLPQKLLITAHFPHQTQMDQVMNARIKRLVSYDLYAGDENRAVTNEALQISGEVVKGNSPDQFRLIRNGQAHQVILGNRNARMLGFSILNLKPFETEVFVVGRIENGSYFADEIEFAPVGDPLKRETSGLPRCLFIGDTVSFNYQRPLREALSGVVNLHHPPLNCRGSSNWNAVHRWLGVFNEPGRQWDVITFNFGLWDDMTTKEDYQLNLRKVIEDLLKAKAKLIWVDSTPIDYGYNTDSQEGMLIEVEKRAELTREADNPVGRVPGRMKLQNKWAAEVLADFPEIRTCELWQVVKDGQATIYKDWWYNKEVGFDYPQSIPLGRALAKDILESLGKSGDELRPLTAHAVKVDELSDK